MSVTSQQESKIQEHLELISNEGKIEFVSMEQLAGFEEKFLSVVLVTSNSYLLKNDFNKPELYGFVWGNVSSLSLYLGFKSGCEFSSLLYAMVLEKLDSSLSYDEAFTVTETFSESEDYQQGVNQGSESASRLANFILENNSLESYQDLTLDILQQCVVDYYIEQEPQKTEFSTTGTLNQTHGPIGECVGRCLDCLILSLSYAKVDIFSLSEDESQFTFGYISGVCDSLITSSGEEINDRSAVVITTQVLARLFGEDKCHDLFESLVSSLKNGLPLTMSGYTQGQRDAQASSNSFPPLELANFFLQHRQ